MEKIRVWSISHGSDYAPKDQNSGDAGDFATDLEIGGGQLLQATAAVGDLVARPFRSKDGETFSERLANAGEAMPGSAAWMEKKRAEYSAARQASEQDYEDKKAAFGDSTLGRIGGTAYGLITNPRAAIGRVVQSAPAMLAGGGVGGAVGKAVALHGAKSAAIARAATLGSSAAEGVQSGANNAYDLINYNVQNGRGRYQGVGASQAITALGVGATSLLGAKVGGGIEASIFNKEARQALKQGNKGTARAFLGEGGEESVQSMWEDIPQNISKDRPWDEGLYEDMVEGGYTGGLMGGGVHVAHRALGTMEPTSVLNNAPTQQDAQAAQPQRAIEPPATIEDAPAQERPSQPQAPVEDAQIVEERPKGALDGTAVQPSVEQVQADAVRRATDQTPMAGAQPAQPVPPRQPTPEEIKAQQKAAQQAEKNFRKHYSIPSGVEVPADVIQVDQSFRNSAPARLVQIYDAAVRGNILNNPDPKQGVEEALALMDTLKKHPEMANPDAFDAVEKVAVDEGRLDDALVMATLSYAVRNPQGDLKKFTKERRKQYEEDAKAKAKTQAAKDYMTAYGREPGNPKEVEDDANWRRQNAGAAPLLGAMIKANNLVGARIKGKALREKAALHNQVTPEATLASLQSQLDRATNPVDQDFYAATLEALRNPEADLSAFIANRQQERAAQGVEIAAAQAKAATDAQVAESEAKAEKAIVPTADEWLGMSKEKRGELAKKIEASGDNELIKKFNELKEGADKFQSMQKVEGEKHDTHKAEQKAQSAEKKEEAPKAEKAEETAKPAEEKPAEEKAKPAPKPKKAQAKKADDPRVKAYLEATRDPQLVQVLKNAGLIDKRKKSIPFQDISKPEFQEKVSKLAEPIYLEALRRLRDIAQAYDPKYKLEIPTLKEVKDNAYDAVVKAEEKKTEKSKLTEAPKTKSEEDQLLHDYFMGHQVTAHKLYKSIGDSTGKSDEDIANALVEDLVRSPRAIARKKYLRLARGGAEGTSTTMAEDNQKAPVEEDETEDTESTDAPEVSPTSDESVVDELNKDTGSDTMESDLLATPGARIEANGAKTSLPDGIAAGDKVIRKVRDAYKAADLPDPVKTPASAMLVAIKKVEQEVVSKLKKLVVHKDGGAAEPDLDAIGEVAMGYIDFAQEAFGSNPELVRLLNTESPVIQWAMKQMVLKEGAEFGASGKAYSLFGWVDKALDKAGDALATVREAPHYVNAFAKALAYRKELLGRDPKPSDWCVIVSKEDLRKLAERVQAMPGGKEALRCTSYWKGNDNEGIAVDLEKLYGSWENRDVQAAMEELLTPNEFRNLQGAMDLVYRYDFDVPDCQLVFQGRQIIPSRDTVMLNRAPDAYHGLNYIGQGRSLDLLTGKVRYSGKRSIATIALTRDAVAYTAEQAYTTGAHEMLHAIDRRLVLKGREAAPSGEQEARIKADTGLSGLNKFASKRFRFVLTLQPEYPLFVKASKVFKDHPHQDGLERALCNAGVDRVTAARLATMSDDERTRIAWLGQYPDYAADKWLSNRLHAEEGKPLPREATPEELTAKSNLREIETFAAFGQLFANEETEAALRKAFPGLAHIIDSELRGIAAQYNNSVNAPWGVNESLGLQEDTNANRRTEPDTRGKGDLGASRQGGLGRGKPTEDQGGAGNSEDLPGADQSRVQGARDFSRGNSDDVPGVGADSASGKDAFTRNFIEKQLKKGPAAAKLAGIDPALYETEEWKAVAQAHADATYAVKQATGSVGGCRTALKTNNTPEGHQKLQEAMKRQDEAKLKEALARQAFNDFEDTHRSKVEPPKGKAVEQVENQFAYNKLADLAARRLHAPWLRKVINDAGAWGYRHGLGMMFTRDLVDTVKDKLQSVTMWAHVNDLIDQEARTHQDKAVKIGQDFRNLSQEEQDAVNRLLESSVMDGVWYDIPVGKDGKPVSKAEVTDSAEYAALSKEAKQVYCDVLRMGVETRNTVRKYMVEEIERRYDDQITNASDEEVAKDFQRQKEQALARLKAILPESDKPYVPLRRFGKYVVVMKTQDYVDAVAAYHAAKEAAEDKGATRRDKRDMEVARQKVLSMMSNGKDYVVEYVESPDDAMVRAKELEKELGGTASYFERSVFMKSEQVHIQQLLNLVDRAERQATGVDDDFTGHSLAVKNKVNELATMLYIQSLSENSALKSRLPRRKVAGASHDMMRAFMATASNESRYLGYLKHGGELRKALSAMEDEARTSDRRAAAAVIFNEVRQRIEQDMVPLSTSANGILRTTSVMMLLTNPAFFLQNLTQPLLYSATYMGGRFGLMQPLTLTARQMKDVAMWLKEDGTLSGLDKLVEEKKISEDEKNMLMKLRESGLLDIGLSQEFGEFNRATLSPTMGKLAGWTDMLASAARKVEIINRVSSALVAYRLEKARLMGKGMTQAEAEAAATKFADHVLYETHGDYSSRNTPRYFKANDFARVVTQFRKFQLIQLGLFVRMLKQALDKTPSEERHFARLGLAYTMGAFLAVTGVKGLPLYGVMAVALGLAGGPGDDDEDVLRKTLADAGVDRPIIELIVRGLPAMLGLDLSDKLGAGSILSPFPYLEGNKLTMKNGPDDALEILSQVLGPAASLLVRASRGASYGWQGDYTKAAENLLPSGFANVVKATRFGLEGLTTKAGDVVIPGEQFTFGDLIMQGVGLPTTRVTNRNLLVSSLYRHEETYNQWAKEIRYSFTQAVKSHDLRRRSEAVQEWKRMNEMRRRAGFAPNKISNLTGAVSAQRKREQGAIGGVETNKSNRGFVKQAHELY